MPRGSAKGEKRGGRAKNVPNKRTKELAELLEETFPGYNPVIQMAGIAQDETVDIGHRVMCAREVAHYLFPKRKAVDMKVDAHGEVVRRVIVGLNAE